MTREEAGDKAESLFKNGYNCAQSVFLTFAEEFGTPKDFASSVSLAFGGGMARTRGVCGCVSGLLMAAGLYSSSNKGSDPDKSLKDDCYKISQDLIEGFRAGNGSIICAELLGLSKKPAESDTSFISSDRNSDYYKKRPCPKLCRFAAELFYDKVLS